MKIDKERKAFLKNEFEEYAKKHLMTEDERKALLAWVKAGNSVYENSMMAVGYDYLTEYRDTKYIRESTIGMTPEAAQRFAWDYYGWDYDSKALESNTPSLESELIKLGY